MEWGIMCDNAALEMLMRGITTLFLNVFFLCASAGAPALAGMTINGRTVDSTTAQFLTREHGVPASGAYWYDPKSGLIGTMGLPPGKQIPPGDQRFGPVAYRASGAEAGVVINGRGISFKELFALEHRYTMMVDGDYSMGPDLVMRKNYPGAPSFDYGKAWNSYAAALEKEKQWCAMVRSKIKSAGRGKPVLVPELGGAGYSVQVTQDSNGCMMANVQGRFFSRCCDQ